MELDRVGNILLIGGIIALGIGYLLGQIRRGKLQATSEAVELASTEIELLKSARDRTSRSLHEAQMNLEALNTKVEALTKENNDLRGLIMLEQIPPALNEAFRTVIHELLDQQSRTSEADREYYTKMTESASSELDERLERIEQGVHRLLTAGGEE